MDSLIELIRKGRLPLHQFMDLETVNWIKENRPPFNISTPPKFNLKGLIDNDLSEIKKYIPDPNWFLVSKKKDSIRVARRKPPRQWERRPTASGKPSTTPAHPRRHMNRHSGG